MHVVFSLDNLNAGGTELNAVRTAELLAERGVRVSLAAFQPDGPLRERFEAAGVRVTPFPLTSLRDRNAVAQALRLRRFLRSERADVLHAHDMYSNIFSVPVARLARTAGVVASRRWWAPPERAHQLANRWAYRCAHRVVANADAIRDMLARDEGVPRERSVLVPNFVEPAAFAAPPAGWRDALLRELGVPPERVVIGCVANLVPVKNHALLLRALAAMREREAVLVLFGRGELQDQLEQESRRLGVRERVFFGGFRHNRPNLHHLFDVSTLASTSEGMPNTLLEAMAAGRPVVATGVGAVAELVTPDSGAVVPSGDADAMAAALDALVRDPALRSALGRAGLERARSRHSPDAAIDRLLPLYESLAAPTGSNSESMRY